MRALLLVAASSLEVMTGAAHADIARVPSVTGPAPSPTEQVMHSLAGIPEKGSVLGRENAPVTLQYFADLECPFCRQFDLQALQALIARYVRPGKLRIDFRAFETATREPIVFYIQQVAALAAGRQGKMWYFVELFFREQGEEDSGYVTERYLSGLADQVPGLQLPEWEADRNDRSLFLQVRNDERAAYRASFTGTPSFLIGRTGKKLRRFEYGSLTNPTEIEQAVRRLLR